MTDFGYASDGTPVQWTVEFAGESDERGYWQDSWGNPYNRDEVTPAKVARPGQVVVDAYDLHEVIHDYAIERDDGPLPTKAEYLDLAARDALAVADVQESRTDTETEHAAPGTDPNYRYCGCGRQVWGLKEGGRCHECYDRDTAAPDTGDSGSCGECGVWTDDRTWGVCPGCFECNKEADASRDTITRADLEDIEAWATGEIEAAERRAAKRGRDEALAGVVKALRTFNTNSREYVEECEIGDIADQIEREAGGDGHA